ncbi:hypothetical protein [Limnobacter sp.]|uniref:hypothetical protein n=1 Tax=Limnobacter sp. TaxID=2003368 RepID=UPI003519A359
MPNPIQRPSQAASAPSEAEALHVSTAAVEQHVIRKAGFKQISPNHVVRLSFAAKLRMWVEGNAADDRYHRAKYESQQRVGLASMAEQYRHTQSGAMGSKDLRNSDLVNSRFGRQDNLRFNTHLFSKNQGLNGRARAAVALARGAHYANGVTELAAAPTGMLLKVSKITTTPKHNDSSLTSQARVIAFLGPVAAAVSHFSRQVFSKGIQRLCSGVTESIRKDIQNIVGGFSAVAACSALVSLACSGVSAVCARGMSITSKQVKSIELDNQRYTTRILDLLRRAEQSSGFREVLGLALKKKIPQAFCMPGEGKEPILLHALMNAVAGQPESLAKQKIAQVLGAYQTHSQVEDLIDFNSAAQVPPELLDPKKDRRTCLWRENHVVALTNLIEHNRLHADPKGDFKDLRHRVEQGATTLRSAAERVADDLKPAGGNQTKGTGRYSSASMVQHSHRYRPVTVALARASEALRVFNHGVVMSLNYQLTRPVAWLAGRLTEHVLAKPNSRTVSFSIGRLVASSIWAVVDSVLLISLAGGNGVGFNGPGLDTAVKFPLKVPFKLMGAGIGITSTASQMVLVAVPAAILMGMAKAACWVEGWKGQVAADPQQYAKRGRTLIEI